MSDTNPDSRQRDTASPAERLLQVLFTEPSTAKAANELAAIPDPGQDNTASPVERLLQMLFTEPPTLKTSNELALTILHQLFPFTFPKRTKKDLRRHSVSEPPKTTSPIQRVLKSLFSPPQILIYLQQDCRDHTHKSLGLSLPDLRRDLQASTSGFRLRLYNLVIRITEKTQLA